MEQKWETAPHKAWKDTNKWLLDHIAAWFLAFFLPGVGTMLATLLIPANASVQVASLLGFVGGILGLIILFLVVYITHMILALKRQRDEARKLYDPIRELAQLKEGDTIKDKDISVPLMFQQSKNKNLLTNLTFDHCILRGPCLVAFQGNTVIDNCHFTSKLDEIFFRGESGHKYDGVGFLVHCKFNYCEFNNLSFLIDDNAIQWFKKMVVQL